LYGLWHHGHDLDDARFADNWDLTATIDDSHIARRRLSRSSNAQQS